MRQFLFSVCVCLYLHTKQHETRNKTGFIHMTDTLKYHMYNIQQYIKKVCGAAAMLAWRMVFFLCAFVYIVLYQCRRICVWCRRGESCRVCIHGQNTGTSPTNFVVMYEVCYVCRVNMSLRKMCALCVCGSIRNKLGGDDDGEGGGAFEQHIFWLDEPRTCPRDQQHKKRSVFLESERQ